MLVLTALAIVKRRRLFAVVMLSGVFSLLSALLFVALDAVDVAFTEAAVGAGISTVLMLGTIALTSRREKKVPVIQPIPLIVVLITGRVDLWNPGYAHSLAMQTHPLKLMWVLPILNRVPRDIDVPNIVTAVLASYRGFDTLGEVIVVFAAGLGVILLLSGLGRRRDDPDDEGVE